MTYRVKEIIKRVGIIVSEPVIQGYRNFAEIILLEHVLVPHDELDDAKLVREREVYRKVERGVLGVVRRVDGALGHMCLVLRPQQRDDDDSGREGQNDVNTTYFAW